MINNLWIKHSLYWKNNNFNFEIKIIDRLLTFQEQLEPSISTRKKILKNSAKKMKKKIPEISDLEYIKLRWFCQDPINFIIPIRSSSPFIFGENEIHLTGQMLILGSKFMFHKDQCLKTTQVPRVPLTKTHLCRPGFKNSTKRLSAKYIPLTTIHKNHLCRQVDTSGFNKGESAMWLVGRISLVSCSSPHSRESFSFFP